MLFFKLELKRCGQSVGKVAFKNVVGNGVREFYFQMGMWTRGLFDRAQVMGGTQVSWEDGDFVARYDHYQYYDGKEWKGKTEK